jgi:hypothetical protein
MKYPFPTPRQPGNYDPVAAADECCVSDYGPSKTQQSQADDADINTIVNRFLKTGFLPDDIRAPVHADFDEIYDYHSAMTAVAEANSSFMKMPAATRQRFNHDPQEFVAFCSDPANLPQLRELGLAHPEPVSKRETPPPAEKPETGTVLT